LSHADYENQLAERKAQSMRPLCVCSREQKGVARYTVVWLGGLGQAR
jgi:hypothetical protein